MEIAAGHARGGCQARVPTVAAGHRHELCLLAVAAAGHPTKGWEVGGQVSLLGSGSVQGSSCSLLWVVAARMVLVLWVNMA